MFCDDLFTPFRGSFFMFDLFKIFNLTLYSDYLFQVHGSTIELRLPRDLVISSTNGIFRLNYSPPHGSPLPGVTYRPSDIHAKNGLIIITNALPGEEYSFQLHYINGSSLDTLIYSTKYITGKLTQQVEQKFHFNNNNF